MNYKIIPKDMFNICLIDQLKREDICKLYSLKDFKKKSIYYLDKFDLHLKRVHGLNIKEYCIKYLNIDWPKCSFRGVDLGYKISSHIQIMMISKGSMNKENNKKFREWCEKMSVNRVGAGNPMYNKIPWNLDKTFSSESKLKMSYSAAKRLALKKEWGPTKIEIAMARFLLSLNLKFEEQYQIGYFCLDFAFPNDKICIEIDGDYWHCNPLFYPNGPINLTQKKSITADKRKDSYLSKLGWKIFRAWEHEINSGEFKQKLILFLAENNILNDKTIIYNKSQ